MPNNPFTVDVRTDGHDKGRPVWSALIGENLAEGVAGYGPTPAAALIDLAGSLGDNHPDEIAVVRILRELVDAAVGLEDMLGLARGAGPVRRVLESAAKRGTDWLIANHPTVGGEGGGDGGG